MQRQAVPLLRTSAPAGRHRASRASWPATPASRVVAQRDGVVDQVDASAHRGPGRRGSVDGRRRRPRSTSTTSSSTSAPTRTPASTRSPSCSKGDRVKKGDVIADGPATETGELALGAERGRRLHAVAGLQLRGLDPHQRAAHQGGRLHLDPHRGVRVHRPRHQARQGRDHPRHPERRRGGPQGPRRVGHHPHRRRGRSRATSWSARSPPRARPSSRPEEKLLRAIFGEKAGDVRDSSLRVPPGVQGTVINAKVFCRKGVDKDERAKQIESEEEAKLLKDQNDEIKIIQDSAYKKIAQAAASARRPSAKLVDDKGKVASEEGRRPQRRAARRGPRPLLGRDRRRRHGRGASVARHPRELRTTRRSW